MIRVMLVENDDFWIEHLSNDLGNQPDMALVKVAKTKEEAIAHVTACEVDVVLMDINLTENNLDGIEATEYISKMGIKVIMLTSLSEKDIVLDSFESGVINFIYKSNYKDILNAIREVKEDRVSIHTDIVEILRTEFVNARKELRLQSLTPREREVYDMRKNGLNKSQIAEKLHKSLHTIKNQWKSAREKLKLKAGD